MPGTERPGETQPVEEQGVAERVCVKRWASIPRTAQGGREWREMVELMDLDYKSGPGETGSSLG